MIFHIDNYLCSRITSISPLLQFLQNKGKVQFIKRKKEVSACGRNIFMKYGRKLKNLNRVVQTFYFYTV